MNKIILDLCGGTGSWSKPYREAGGYEVQLITLPEFDVLESYAFVEFEQKFICFRNQLGGKKVLVPITEIYGILCAPPCTQFSRARTTAKTPRDLQNAMKLVRYCISMVDTIKIERGNTLKFWALENPMSMLRQFLGKPPHSFRGWEWGDDHMKFTDLWGYYNMPTKKIKVPPKKFNRKNWAAPKAPTEYKHLKLDHAAVRAITPPKFAKAFMEANK